MEDTENQKDTLNSNKKRIINAPPNNKKALM